MGIFKTHGLVKDRQGKQMREKDKDMVKIGKSAPSPKCRK